MYNDAKSIIDSFTTIKHEIAGSIAHTDSAANYTSKSYQNMLRKYDATQSQCHELKIRLITVILNFDSVSLKLN